MKDGDKKNKGIYQHSISQALKNRCHVRRGKMAVSEKTEIKKQREIPTFNTAGIEKPVSGFFWFLMLLVFSALIFQTGNTYAGQASLSLTAPATNTDGTPLTDLAGYNIYYGTASGDYTQTINVGNVANYTVSNLAAGTYYFVATAYDSAGNQSAYSDVVSASIASQATLTVSDSGTGSGTVTSSPSGISCGTTCSGTYNSGTAVTLTATAAANSTFAGWSGGGCAGTGTCSFTVNSNTAVTATFSANTATYTITATAGTGGSLTPSGSTTVNSGSSQAYAIAPSSGYSIASVLVDGASVGAVSSYTFSNVAANHTISATFSANPVKYTITATAGTGGGLTPSGSTTVNSGSSQTYAIAPSSGYSIASVLVDGASVGAVSSYTFSKVTANHTISATFTANPITYTITATAGTGGSLTPSGSTTVNSGSSQAYAIAPSSGYSIASVLVDGASVGAVSSYTFSKVTANHTISATFTANPITYTITATAGTGGSLTPSGSTTVNSGSSQAYAIAPSSGYSIASVLVDGASVGAVSSYSFSNVTAKHTISATFTAISTSTGTSSTAVFAVNAGGPQYTSTTGIVYKADTDYSGGSVSGTTAAISGTSDGKLYQTIRVGGRGTFSYNIPLADGNYNVTLKFCETFYTAAGERVFNVSMQGTQVISKLDLYATVGKDVAHDVTIPVSVTNGKLNINFSGIVQEPIVNAILVTRQ